MQKGIITNFSFTTSKENPTICLVNSLGCRRIKFSWKHFKTWLPKLLDKSKLWQHCSYLHSCFWLYCINVGNFPQCYEQFKVFQNSMKKLKLSFAIKRCQNIHSFFNPFGKSVKTTVRETSLHASFEVQVNSLASRKVFLMNSVSLCSGSREK